MTSSFVARCYIEEEDRIGSFVIGSKLKAGLPVIRFGDF
jgi:hypothetical protein